MEKINALGKQCPLPVIEMKKAIKDHDKVEIKVDNEISTQNLKKLADEYLIDYDMYKEADRVYVVTFTKTAESKKPSANVEDQEELVKSSDYCVVIDDNKMGGGNEELGGILIKSFLYALTEQDILPTRIIFYNAGVHLSAVETEHTEDLKKLEEAGVEILTCGLCLDFYEYDKENVSVGSVTNMYEIVRLLRASNNIVKP